MRTFEKTHPWLVFALDVRNLSYTTWLLLGEAMSKIEHIAGVPLSPEAADELHRIYLAKGALATTAIEGNTLTEEQVRQHLEKRLTLPPSQEYLSKEIDNIVDACNRIGEQVIHGGRRDITSADIQAYNALVLRDLPLAEGVVPGTFREHSVVVGTYRAAPAEDCAYLLGKFCAWLNQLRAPAGLEAPYAILTAIAAHLYFVWIHPFGDGNGRTARLIEFRCLLQAGFPTPAAHLLSNFYNLTRTEYYRQLDQASRMSGRMDDFLAYAARGLVDQLREQLGVIRNLQWDTTWRNYVYERFGEVGPPDARRRRLILDLSKVTEDAGWVSVSSIPELTPRLARNYSARTSRTLARDLDILVAMGLVRRSGANVKANKEIILAFLPVRAAEKGAEKKP